MRKKNEAEQPQALGEEHAAQEPQEKEVQSQPQKQEQVEESQQAEQEEPKQESEPKQEIEKQAQRSRAKAKAVESKEAPTAKEQEAPDESQQRIQALEREVLELRSRNAAYVAGVRPDMVEDAVTLSMAQAKVAGEVTEETVQQAMEQVLQRHPEWKAAPAGKKVSGGFVLGSDPSRTSEPKSANGRKENKKTLEQI